MKLTLTPQGAFALETAALALRGLCPVVNGRPLKACVLEVLEHAAGVRVRWTGPDLDGAAFELEAAHRAAPDRVEFRCRLIGWPDAALDSFGLRFERVENLRAYLRNGYFSWDGSFYVEPEALAVAGVREPRLQTGYAMTQLLPRTGAGAVVIGFDRHDRFQQTFTVDAHAAPPSLTVLTLWDRKSPAPDGVCESERLVVLEHADVEESLRAWARLVAQAAPVPPRVPDAPITGWCSWYNLYASLSEDIVRGHLRGVAEVASREDLPMRVFQLDDGFTPEMGDWLEVKPQFPRGIKPVLDEIRAAGFVPGLWIGPFMVGNRSRLYREHPDWVVRDRLTGGPLALMTFYGEFRWHKRSEEYYILDTTHLAAFDYLRQVFRTWRHDWGCEYFKTDFMHFPTEHGPDRALWHTPGLTRIEIWRQVAEMIREEIGDATWLGCGCPLWASVGLVDAVRIGRDVGVQWAGNQSAQSMLRDQATRSFGGGILWQTDPDCILLRERFHHLTDAEVRALAIYAGMSGGLIMTSDALDELSEDRLRLWKLVLTDWRSHCRYPLLGQSPLVIETPPGAASPSIRALDPVMVQVRTPGGASPNDDAALFVFNTGEIPVQRRYTLAALGLPAARCVMEWPSGERWPDPVDTIDLTLAPHAGTLLFLSTVPLDRLPAHLP
ncbi:MAG TPA: alpha-galactosidase [Aggregatilinea sp.]|uniref:glycoside hydrolase family 36 protein n=1 Tax=Aggregatilinea sp. TaxID=2806333 RepID=UPI002C029022|nr:glycoside hydrolase family 36 protein [Aggregatilinea sp.]HML24185.1 alpha-galactosidase [Aggregatilinea sp.]